MKELMLNIYEYSDATLNRHQSRDLLGLEKVWFQKISKGGYTLMADFQTPHFFLVGRSNALEKWFIVNLAFIY
jgi:hypothetical protein